MVSGMFVVKLVERSLFNVISVEIVVGDSAKILPRARIWVLIGTFLISPVDLLLAK